MFKFEPAERCLYGGVSPATIGQSIRNEFLMLFGDPNIDYRISVVLNERNIQFFYYDGEPDFDLSARNMDKFKELGSISITYPKETGNDILKFPKIGADCYPSGTNLDFFHDKKEPNFLPILSSFQKLFYNFPFLKKYDEDSANENKDPQHPETNKKDAELNNHARENTAPQRLIDAQENFRNFIKSCLLAFIFEFEDREEIFSNSPLYDKVRDNLRESDVYRLLSSKIQYTLYVPENGINYDLDEYTYRTQKFADRLMDKRINKVIAPYDYTSKRKSSAKKGSQYRQTWFYDPEDELEGILDRNRKQLHVPKKERQGQELVFAPHLEQKIKNFLYTKHAISNAMTRKSGKRFFWVNQFLMLFISAAIIVSCFSPKLSHTIFGLYLPWAIIIGTIVFFVTILFNRIKENKTTRIYSRFIYGWRAGPQLVLLAFILALVVFSILKLGSLSTSTYFFCLSLFSILLIGSSGYFNNPLKNFNKPKKLLSIDIAQSFYPRILVAELAAWLTLGIGEDLVKSMLWINDNRTKYIIPALVLLFLTAILMGEAKQHSPYKSSTTNLLKKVLPILNHSIYFALCIGIIMQFLFYDNLVKNSDVIPNIVYSDYLDDANYYCQNLEHLDESMRQLELLTITSSIIGNVEMQGKAQFTSIITDTTGHTLGKILSRNSMTMRNKNTLKTEEYNKYVNLINVTIKEIIKLKQDSSYKDCDYFPFFNVNNDSCQTAGNCYCFLDTLNSDTARNRAIIDTNRIRIDMLKLNGEIANVKRGISMYDNYDTLMDWSKYETKYTSLSGSMHLDALTAKAKEEHQCWEEVTLSCRDNTNVKFKLFPTLLLFHTLIVLVLAFVTQLIISDKSVTEPL